MSLCRNNLEPLIISKNGSKLKEALNNILKNTNVEVTNVDVFKSLFDYDEDEILKLSVQLAADFTKLENNRSVFSQDYIIKPLLTFLTHSNHEIVYQTLRALGNICYENEEGCRLVGEAGLKLVLQLLSKRHEYEDNLMSVASGCLLNLLSPCEALQKKSLTYDTLKIIENTLEKYITNIDNNEFLFINLLSVLNLLLEFLEELSIQFSSTLCSILVRILKVCVNPEICALCLDLLHGASENEELKVFLAKEGLCQLIFRLVEKYGNKADDDDSRAVLKTACDLIVIILTEDDCMDLLYDDGHGEVYRNMLSWLESKDNDLLTTGVLAIGNFARKDHHCIQMVENGTAKILLDILSKHNTLNGDLKLQHALLSALRNLAIPQPNKEKLLTAGLIPILHPLIASDQYLVIFKLLGTLRMMIDSQEKAALQLLQDEELLKRLIYWCYNSDHLGVRGEVPRLITWLIKNCGSTKAFHKLLHIKDGVKCVVEMVSSNHAVMQNEAFYSLTLLSVAFKKNPEDEQKFLQSIVEAEIGKQVAFVVNKYSDKTDLKTTENLLTLLESISKSRNVIDHLRATGVSRALEKLNENDKHAALRSKIEAIICTIDGAK